MNRREFIKLGLGVSATLAMFPAGLAGAEEASYPVVDIHCHLLTTKDLAIRGFIKRHAEHHGIPDPVVGVILKIIEAAERKEKGLKDGPTLYRRFVDSAETFDEPQDSILEELYLDLVEKKASIERIGKTRFKNILKWVGLMLKKHDSLASKMVDTYPEVNLFVPMMVDFDGWVTDDNAQYRTNKQIEVLESLVKTRTADTQPSNTGAPCIHPFVSFNPLKAIKSEGYSEEDANNYFEEVRAAVLKRGFLGVKVYPPAGFRPAGNDNERLLKIVDSRYHRSSLAEEIDEVMGRLFEFCSRYEVPVASHCTETGAEGSPSLKSGLESNPKYWYQVLKTGRYPNLRVNLNHFGRDHSSDVEFDPNVADSPEYPENQSWSTCIAWMMKRFPGQVYADIGYFTWADEDYSELFKSILNSFPQQMRDYLMYGTDWHMLRKDSSYKDYQESQTKIFTELYSEVFPTTEQAKQALSKFFGKNAFSFLGLVAEQPAYRRLNCYYHHTLKHRSPSWIGGYPAGGDFSPELPWDCGENQ